MAWRGFDYRSAALLLAALLLATGCGDRMPEIRHSLVDLEILLPRTTDFPAGYRVVSPSMTTSVKSDDTLATMTLGKEQCRPLVDTSASGRHAAVGLADREAMVAYLVEVPEPGPDIPALRELLGQCGSVVAQSSFQRISFDISASDQVAGNRASDALAYRITGISEAIEDGRRGNFAHFVQLRMVGKLRYSTASARVTITSFSGQVDPDLVDTNTSRLRTVFDQLSAELSTSVGH